MTRPARTRAEYFLVTRPSVQRLTASKARAAATVLRFTFGTTQRA
jgi:hypothetical protein